jgi:hypothetical protein
LDTETEIKMRFILVQCAANNYPSQQHYRAAGWKEFRATCGESNIDVFFWSPTVEWAKHYLRRKYPGCTFSDELSGPALWAIHHGGLMQ